MAINFPTVVYLPCFDVFARPVTFIPLVSQPGQPNYLGRGIYDTNEVDVVALDGSILTDARTELDILMMEFPVLPLKGDRVDISVEEDIDGGLFDIADVQGHGNAGGELTLRLSRVQQQTLIAEAGALGYSLGALDFAQPTLTVV